MSFSTRLLSVFLIILLGFAGQAFAGLDENIDALQSRWAKIIYRMDGEDQVKAFELLAGIVDQVTNQYPDRAEAWIWSAIIKSSNIEGGGDLGSKEYTEQAKHELERAIELDGDALQGSAYTRLGTLYYKTAGWPIGFGDDDKAEELLKRAVAINPDGIDSNYFYGAFLIDQKRYEEAHKYLIKASQATPRPGRELADEGRQKAISEALDTIGDELQPKPKPTPKAHAHIIGRR